MQNVLNLGPTKDYFHFKIISGRGKKIWGGFRGGPDSIEKPGISRDD